MFRRKKLPGRHRPEKEKGQGNPQKEENMSEFDLDLELDLDRDSRRGGYGNERDGEYGSGGYGGGRGGYGQGQGGQSGRPQGAGNTVSGQDLLSGRGRDSEGRPVEPQGRYVVTRDRGAEQAMKAAQKPQERRVLVEVPESALSQLPRGARVVEGGADRGRGLNQGNGGRHADRRGSELDVDLSFGNETNQGR